MVKSISHSIAEKQQALLKPLTPSSRIPHLKESLDLLKQEVRFYRKFLSLGVCKCPVSLEDRPVLVPTTFERELLWNIENTLHHFGLIKIGLDIAAPCIGLPAHFGKEISSVSAGHHRLQLYRVHTEISGKIVPVLNKPAGKTSEI